METPENTLVSGVYFGRDKDGGDRNYTVTDGPAHVSLVMNPDGSYTYTSDPD
ncbi:MAG: hypothetical protein JG765_627 [Cereibacter sp.]|nr:hypothetical protein [Cereibacter sp.]